MTATTRPSDAKLELVTSWFEGYCDRGLAARTIVDEEVFFNELYRIYVWCFPLMSLLDVTVDDAVHAGTYYQINRHAGYFYSNNTGRPTVERAYRIIVSYTGGYSDATVPCPPDLAHAFATCVGVEASVAGVSTSSGGSGAIKSIGLGSGALSVQFDSGTVIGGISGSYDVSGVPTEVQSYASVLDRYVRQRV